MRPPSDAHPIIEEGFVKIVQCTFAALAGVLLACASNPTPVTVSGEAADRASLAGKWSGEYNSQVTGRTGSIVFNLSPAGDAATGDVVMIPKGYGRPLTRFERTTTTSMQNTDNSQVLTIKPVRVSGDTVSGVLDAYRDPQCDCAVETSFIGVLSGNTINGTFTTRGSPSIAPQTGTWRVKRSG
jgi:hypothetical protein